MGLRSSQHTSRGFLIQPLDGGEVAGRMAELALAETAGRVPDIGGPEVRTVANLARTYLQTAELRRRVVEVPLPGKMARAFREGAQAAPEGIYGKIRWEEFLEGVIPQERRTGS